MGTTERKYEDAVREFHEAKVAYDAAWRDWVAARGVTALTEEQEKGLSRTYALERRDEVERIDRLGTEVSVLRAEMERRWVEAHEDFQAMRRAGMGYVVERTNTLPESGSFGGNG